MAGIPARIPLRNFAGLFWVMVGDELVPAHQSNILPP